jgi:hypothetical protein
VKLTLWRPGTRAVELPNQAARRAAQSASPGGRQHVTFTSPARGWYYVEVKVATPGFGPYTLSLAKATPLLP